MSTKFRIHAELHVEAVGVEKGEYGDDPKTNYIAYSSSWMCDGQITFSCKPSQLESTLKMIFRVDDPMMKKTQGMLPNMHSSVSVAKPATDSSGKPVSRHFLTREPIYKAPEGSTKDLIMNISKELLGRDPGAGVDLFGDLLDEVITPRKREKP